MDSPVFEFIRTDDFLDNLNRYFDVMDMDGVTKNYHFVLAEDCPDSFDECIDDDGTLITADDTVKVINSLNEEDGAVALLWQRGINGERSISIADTAVSFDLGDSTKYVKAIFLVSGGLTYDTEGTGYVLAYSINNAGVECKNTVIFPCDGVLWTIRYGV